MATRAQALCPTYLLMTVILLQTQDLLSLKLGLSQTKVVKRMSETQFRYAAQSIVHREYPHRRTTTNLNPVSEHASEWMLSMPHR